MVNLDFVSAAVSNVLMVEGGLSNDPNDNGKLTKYGISQAAYPELDISNLTLDQAIEIYRRDYWGKAWCDQLPPSAALLVFDHAVNAGPSVAVSIYQALVGAHVDGVVGNETIALGRDYHKRRSFDALRFYTERRLSYYRSLDDWKHFANSWSKRCIHMLTIAVQWESALSQLRLAGVDL